MFRSMKYAPDLLRAFASHCLMGSLWWVSPALLIEEADDVGPRG